MIDILAAIAMVTGGAAGTLMLVSARRQPEKKAKQLRTLGYLYFGLAALMALLFIL